MRQERYGMKRLLVLVSMFCLMLSMTVFSEEAEIFVSGDFEYSLLENRTAEITGYTGETTELEVPSELDGYSVTSIGNTAFWGCSNLTSITLPESITSIGDNPFVQCSDISFKVSPDHPYLTVIDDVLFSKPDKRLVCCPVGEEVYVVPEGIISIGNNAFTGCSNLTSITLPESMMSIGDSAFGACSSLTNITLPERITSIGRNPFEYCGEINFIVSPDHLYLAVIDGVLFSKPDKRLVCSPDGKEDYVVPEGIMSIGDDAFWGCVGLASITLPESVTSIGVGAFYLCSSLTSITLPDNVTDIGDRAFGRCSSLTSITLPESVTSIGVDAFFDCSKLTITAQQDSYAAQYCKENNLNYTYPGANDWLND